MNARMRQRINCSCQGTNTYIAVPRDVQAARIRGNAWVLRRNGSFPIDGKILARTRRHLSSENPCEGYDRYAVIQEPTLIPILQTDLLFKDGRIF